MANLLLQAGIDPEKEVTWLYDPVFGYGDDSKHVAMLRDGVVDAMPLFPPFLKQLEADGFPILLDPRVVFPRRPGKVTVATKRTIESRADELRAYFRGMIRDSGSCAIPRILTICESSKAGCAAKVITTRSGNYSSSRV